MGKTIKFYTNVMNSVYKQSPEVFHKKGVLKNFTKLTGNHLFRCFLFKKVASSDDCFLVLARIALSESIGGEVLIPFRSALQSGKSYHKFPPSFVIF